MGLCVPIVIVHYWQLHNPLLAVTGISQVRPPIPRLTPTVKFVIIISLHGTMPRWSQHLRASFKFAFLSWTN